VAQVTRLLILLALFLPTAAVANDPGATWWPGGPVCYQANGTIECRYVAPGCELVRVMDDQGDLAGTRRVLFCKAPRNAV
jgi:hypothetical protein